MILATKGYAGNTTVRESNGKKYCTVDIFQDGSKVETLNCDVSVVGKIERFKMYSFSVKYEKQEYQGKVYSQILVVDAKSLSS